VVVGRARGFSLLELMIALALGLFLTMAFVMVLDRCRREMTANETLASVQNAASQAMDALVLDVEHAGFYGLPGNSARQLWRGGTVVAAGDALRQPDASHARAPVTGLPAGIHDCGVNFALDLELAVQAAQGSWSGVNARDCEPTATSGGLRPATDTLTIRHASLQPVAPRAGRLQVYARRVESHAPAGLFADGLAPGPLDARAEVRDVEVRSYYIANNSVGRPQWPALRVKALTESRGAALFRDEEVMPGVEDLQVELGVRNPDTPDAPLRFVPPDFPDLRNQHIIAVRIRLQVRAEGAERAYDLRIERTVALRNVPAA